MVIICNDGDRSGNHQIVSITLQLRRRVTAASCPTLLQRCSVLNPDGSAFDARDAVQGAVAILAKRRKLGQKLEISSANLGVSKCVQKFQGTKHRDIEVPRNSRKHVALPTRWIPGKNGELTYEHGRTHEDSTEMSVLPLKNWGGQTPIPCC